MQTTPATILLSCDLQWLHKNFLGNHIVWSHRNHHEFLRLAQKISICFRWFSIQNLLANNQPCVLWEEGSRQTRMEEEHESLQLPPSLSAASFSIMCTLGRSILYCKSWWVKWNCGCTQTHSSKLPLIDLLFSMWWWTCYYCDFCGHARNQILHIVIAFAGLLMKTLLLRKTLAIALSLLFTTRSKCNSLETSKVDPTAISFPSPPMHLLVGQRNPICYVEPHLRI